MEESKVSVIIPCFNVEKYIDQAVQSVLAQTYTNIEIILVDDGSTDGTSDICDRYAEEYDFVQVIHQENKGQACARNVGIKRATGKYVYFLDSDDWIDQNTFSSVVGRITACDADMIFFDARVVDENGVLQENDKHYIKSGLPEVSQKGIEWYRTMIEMGHFDACVPYHIFKREFLLANQLEFYPEIIHEDELFLFYAYLKARVVQRESGIYYNRRLREGSTMLSQNYAYMYDSLKVIMNYVLDQNVQSKFADKEIDVLALFLKRISRIMVERYSHIVLAMRRERAKGLKRTLKKYMGFVWCCFDVNDLKFILWGYYLVFRINIVA